MAQSWGFRADLPRLCGLMYDNRPMKPGILAEGSYEGAYTEYPTGAVTPELVRREAWRTFLSGAGYTYGHMAIWAHTPSWQQALDDPAARSMAVLKKSLGNAALVAPDAGFRHSPGRTAARGHNRRAARRRSVPVA